MKMKKIALFVLVGFNCLAQNLPVNDETKRVSFVEVVDVPGKNQYDLYSSVKSWGASAFKSSKSTLDLDDKEGGKLVYKGNINAKGIKAVIGSVDAGFFNFVLNVWLKDGKYKVEVTNIVHDKIPGTGSDKNVIACGGIENEKCGNGLMTSPNKKQWVDMKEQLAVDIKDLLASLKKAVAKNEKDF